MNRRQRGLTLVELMVTLAVAIVLLAVGIPAFNTLTARDISATTVNGLVTALQQARAEAISRGRRVWVASANWNQGWSVQWTNDAGATEDLRVYTAPRSSQVTITGVASPLIFTNLGETGANSRFTINAYKDSNTTGTPVRTRYVCVTAGGQVRTEDVAANCP
jgi:type IV fimbrial biogenesis protein FimT